MSHDLAHSTRLPKPPGYNLEWPRVTLIQVTLVTWSPTKASYHDLHPKLCRNPPRDPTLHPKPPGAPLASLGGLGSRPPHGPLTPPGAKRLPMLLPHRSRLAEPTLLPGAMHVQWPLPLFWVAIAWRLVRAPSTMPVAQCYLFLAHKAGPNGPQSHHSQIIVHSYLNRS